MRIVSVRHGESEKNKEKIMQDNVLGELSTIGIMQAKKVAKRLAIERFDRIYCSDSERTMQTAKEILPYHVDTPVIYTNKLRELNAGEYIGKTWDEWRQAKDSSSKGLARFKPKGGESLIEMIQRVKNFIENIYTDNEDCNVLLITHGGPNKALKYLTEGDGTNPEIKGSYLEYTQENCCLNVFKLTGGNLELKLYNSTTHLD